MDQQIRQYGQRFHFCPNCGKAFTTTSQPNPDHRTGRVVQRQYMGRVFCSYRCVCQYKYRTYSALGRIPSEAERNRLAQLIALMRDAYRRIDREFNPGNWPISQEPQEPKTG